MPTKRDGLRQCCTERSLAGAGRDARGRFERDGHASRLEAALNGTGPRVPKAPRRSRGRCAARGPVPLAAHSPAPWHYPLAYSLERESAAQAVSCQEMEVVYNRQAWLSYAGEAHELVPRQVAESVAMERSVGDA